jgi:hypothetical protein
MAQSEDVVSDSAVTATSKPQGIDGTCASTAASEIGRQEPVVESAVTDMAGKQMVFMDAPALVAQLDAPVGSQLDAPVVGPTGLDAPPRRSTSPGKVVLTTETSAAAALKRALDLEARLRAIRGD